nr:hypothetical protein GCM10020185_84880 [Pseudomonas brassicacearum subsp. brassicacearum]
MSILVTGATGTIGSLIIQRLADAGADVKALVRQPGKGTFPAGVTEVVADLTDVPSLREALASVRTLFLLNAVTPRRGDTSPHHLEPRSRCRHRAHRLPVGDSR